MKFKMVFLLNAICPQKIAPPSKTAFWPITRHCTHIHISAIMRHQLLCHHNDSFLCVDAFVIFLKNDPLPLSLLRPHVFFTSSSGILSPFPVFGLTGAVRDWVPCGFCIKNIHIGRQQWDDVWWCTCEKYTPKTMRSKLFAKVSEIGWFDVVVNGWVGVIGGGWAMALLNSCGCPFPSRGEL